MRIHSIIMRLHFSPGENLFKAVDLMPCTLLKLLPQCAIRHSAEAFTPGLFSQEGSQLPVRESSGARNLSSSI